MMEGKLRAAPCLTSRPFQPVGVYALATVAGVGFPRTASRQQCQFEEQDLDQRLHGPISHDRCIPD